MVFTGFGGTTDGVVELGKVLETSTPSSVFENTNETAKLYPNPAIAGQPIQVEWTGVDQMTIQVVDAMGRTVQTLQSPSFRTTLSTGLPSGWYRVVTSSDQNRQSHTLIVH